MNRRRCCSRRLLKCLGVRQRSATSLSAFMVRTVYYFFTSLLISSPPRPKLRGLKGLLKEFGTEFPKGDALPFFPSRSPMPLPAHSHFDPIVTFLSPPQRLLTHRGQPKAKPRAACRKHYRRFQSRLMTLQGNTHTEQNASRLDLSGVVEEVRNGRWREPRQKYALRLNVTCMDGQEHGVKLC